MLTDVDDVFFELRHCCKVDFLTFIETSLAVFFSFH